MYNYHTNSRLENNLTVYGYPQNNERMNISYFQYFSTFSLMLMCYSFINPNFIFNTCLYLAFTFANTFLSSYVFLNDYVYTPYKKYIRRPLYYILNISDKNDEIQIIKDGVIIYSFRTMNDFIKYNPINFVSEYSDDESSSGTEDEENQETDECQSEDKQQVDIETSVDADLTNESVTIHEKSENNENETEDADEENSDDSSDDTDDTNDSDDDGTSDHILDPSEYDFVIRTIYYETNENGKLNTHSYCIKYDTFSKSDLYKTYTHDELNKEVSSRKFIGSNLTFNGVKYTINLTTPNNYYIVGNSIFDYPFLKWYMAEHFDIVLTKKYSMSCIDNFVEMYNITPGQKIIVEKNLLRTTEDETFTHSDSESETESEAQSNTGSENESDEQQEPTNSSDTNDVEILERCD